MAFRSRATEGDFGVGVCGVRKRFGGIVVKMRLLMRGCWVSLRDACGTISVVGSCELFWVHQEEGASFCFGEIIQGRLSLAVKQSHIEHVVTYNITSSWKDIAHCF